jgi:hypothetical protein
VLEQHADRAALFMQWKQLDWPLLLEPFNLLGFTAVPRTFLLDEHGVVRMVHPKLDEMEVVEREFINRAFERPAEPGETVDLRGALEGVEPGETRGWRERAMALALWGSADRLDEAVAAAERSIELEATDRGHFVAGVIRRMRFDSALRQAGDFARATEHWAAALEIGPNNYIWRRRLQQYGPRLDKPYPFFDWVPEARAAIVARGEEPVPLAVEPGGAEYATPSSELWAPAVASEPDAGGRIDRDEEGLVAIETAAVPPAAIPGDPVRVHVALRPNASIGAHWNNEMGPTQLWVDAPEGWEVEQRLIEVELPPDEVSDEPRTFEFELRAPADARSGAARVRGYALYFACEDQTGVCMYRRQDFELSLPVRAGAERLRDERRR